MSFRARLVGAVTAMTLLTLGAAFTAVSATVNHSQERQLDDALTREAGEEAREAAALGGDALAISARPGPAANDVGPLTKYAAIYGRGGAVLASTPTFGREVPRLASLGGSEGQHFDLWHGREHLRGVLVRVPGRAGTLLLLAAPRTDVDGDAAFLARAMLLVFAAAVAWAVVVAIWVVSRLTRDHQAIAQVARRVAAGDLSARVASRSGDREVAQLAQDVDEMIERLGLLVESQQRFIAHAAHELRSPLTSLYGELSHALRRERDPREYRAAIEEALDSTRRLKLLTEDLLALARLGAEREAPATPVSVGELAHAAIEAVRTEAVARGVELVIEGQGPTVSGRARDLERLLRNLIDNAVQHSPPGGRVTVRASHRAGNVEIVVADQGPGVPREDHERIFEPFYRGDRDRARGGTGAGLGLAIVREIARAHGGEVRIDADGPAAPGARFVVSLPMAADRSHSRGGTA